jgi:hypothetical protein
MTTKNYKDLFGIQLFDPAFELAEVSYRKAQN